ncbi:MAG: potassium-transporting ATPase subunit KdpA [Planctomycetota bacterium]|nr:potassium-transporting ATPase subunit KdpA [Planctomycetota bacterium]
MTANAWGQMALYLFLLLGLAIPLGMFLAQVYEGNAGWLEIVLGPVERLIYRLCRIRPRQEMTWQCYAIALLLFNLAGCLVVYLLQRLQGLLPLNAQGLPAVGADCAFNTAVSFATNTNWQSYSGESTMSYLTQMLALTVQNFLSAASGMAVLVAMVRGFVRREMPLLGNFWVDVTRSVLYVLLPLALVLAVMLVSQGVPQTFDSYRAVPLLQSTKDSDGKPVGEQVLALGPVASQEAIKQLGTNGGGFFNVNAAHPYENPTPLSCLLEMLAILLIPAALCITFGVMVRDLRQGFAILAAMTILFAVPLVGCVVAEQHGSPALAAGAWGVDQEAHGAVAREGSPRSLGLTVDEEVPRNAQPGGNMEGKETRFGIADSAIWATATTAASNGSVNSMHDSYTPLGGLVPMWMIQLGEVSFGGAGSGLYGMLAFVIVAVFVAGLMVGRTPEYLGKKIEAYEMKMASLMILIPPLLVLGGTAVAVVCDPGRAGMGNRGAHGFSEVLYAYSSTGNNNGSAFAGLNANTVFYNVTTGLAMLVARYWLAVPALAIAGSLARKKIVPAGPGTLQTHTPLFILVLIGSVLLVGALSFIPALALGPIVEHLQMMR